MDIVRSDAEVDAILSQSDESTKYINYILPTEWYAAEIPMNGVELRQGHYSPSDFDTNHFKVIITKAITKNNQISDIKNLLTKLYAREAIAEIWIDLSEQTVIKILDMPEKVRYEGIPVAVY